MSIHALATLVTCAGSTTSPTAPTKAIDPMDDPEVRAAIEQLAMAVGDGLYTGRVEAAVRSILAREDDVLFEQRIARLRAELVDLPAVLAQATAAPPRAPVVVLEPRPQTRRYMGERAHPRTAYEAALVARWGLVALDGGRRARNSAEFSSVASKLGASEAEILRMIADINRRPR